MINASNIVCLKCYCFCSLIWYYIKDIYIYLFKTASITFLSYILFELLDVEQGSPISHKTVKCNYLGLVLAIDPTSPRGILYTMISKYYII